MEVMTLVLACVGVEILLGALVSLLFAYFGRLLQVCVLGACERCSSVTAWCVR